MRRNILKLLVAATLIANTTAVSFAADANIPSSDTSFDIKEKVVEIIGNGAKGGEMVNIYLVEPSSGEVEHFRSINADSNGNFTYSFKLNTSEGEAYGSYEGWCEFVLSGDKQPIKIYLPGPDEIEGIIEELKLDVALALADADTAEKLGVSENAIFGAVDKDELAQLVEAALEDIEYDEDDAYGQLEDIGTIIEEYSVLEAYNEGLGEHLFGSDGKSFKKNLAIDMTVIDEKYDVTLFECFEKQLSDMGKQEVLDSLLNKGFETTEELEDAFFESAVVQGLKNPKNQVGYDHIVKLLTEENAEVVGIELSDGMSRSIASEMVNIASTVDNIDDVQKLYDDAVEALEKGSGGNRGNSGGGSGSGGGFSSSLIKNNETTENNGFGQGIPAVQSKFTDVANVTWAIDAINHLNERNIMNGVGDGKFEPNRPITREEILKLVCLVVGIEENNFAVEFTDVDVNAWYYPHLCGAVKAEIINGLGDGTFGIGKSVSREDLCVMLYRAANPDKLESPKALTFTDADRISDYAKDAVEFMYSIGAISGYPEGGFVPQGNCTRAEAAKIMYAFMNWNG